MVRAPSKFASDATIPQTTEVFEKIRQCRNTALQKNRSPFVTRHSQFAGHQSLPLNQSPIASRYSLIAVRHLPFAIRQSPFTAVFGSAGASPSHDFRRLKSALKEFVINYGLKPIAWFVSLNRLNSVEACNKYRQTLLLQNLPAALQSLQGGADGYELARLGLNLASRRASQRV